MPERASLEPGRAGLEPLLEAESVAVVGASPRPGSFGERLLTELARSPRVPEITLVNPRYAGTSIRGRPVVASLLDLAEPVDLVLLAVGDASLEPVLLDAAERGDRSAVIYGSAVDRKSPADSPALRARLAAVARRAGMPLCGAGCMGFVSQHVRAIGYLERSPMPPGPIALVTHSGSAFSALLRTDRPFGYTLAVSSGQELVTTAGHYLDYALSLPATGIVALLLETMRSPEVLRLALARAAAAGVPVVALTVGSSEAGRAMVAAHSGALAGGDGAWEALFEAHGVLRVFDLPEMCDTIELLLAGRRAPRRACDAGGDTARIGIAAVFDSGAERALAVDVAAEVQVRFADVAPATLKRLGDLLDPGLEPCNPLDVWGTGAGTEAVLAGALATLAADEAVDAVALAVDLVPEYDGDESYRSAVLRAARESDLPMCVLSHVPAALDREAAARLRSAGVPVLEGTRSGLLAMRHLLELRDFTDRVPVQVPPLDPERAARAAAMLDAVPEDPLAGARVLAEYGIVSPPTLLARSPGEAVAAAGEIGLPVAVKTAAGVTHKADLGGVVLGVSTPEGVAAAYARLATIGPGVTVSAMAPEGVELSLGVVTDPLLGPLVVVGAGGELVELLADRVVALPPLDLAGARRHLGRLGVHRLLEGYRGRPPAALGEAAAAVVAMAQLALEIGDALQAIEVNPLSCSATGVLALDVLVELRPTAPSVRAAPSSGPPPVPSGVAGA